MRVLLPDGAVSKGLFNTIIILKYDESAVIWKLRLFLINAHWGIKCFLADLLIDTHLIVFWWECRGCKLFTRAPLFSN